MSRIKREIRYSGSRKINEICSCLRCYALSLFLSQGNSVTPCTAIVHLSVPSSWISRKGISSALPLTSMSFISSQQLVKRLLTRPVTQPSTCCPRPNQNVVSTKSQYMQQGAINLPRFLQNCVALLRRPQWAASNSSLSATVYVPVSGGHSGKHATWLRQRRLDRPPGLSYASSAVSPQRSCAANFQLASLRPCLWRTHQPSWCTTRLSTAVHRRTLARLLTLPT